MFRGRTHILISRQAFSRLLVSIRRPYTSPLVAAREVSACELQLVAADEVSVGAGLTGEAVVAMSADSDGGTLLERLGHLIRARRHHLLLRVTEVEGGGLICCCVGQAYGVLL